MLKKTPPAQLLKFWHPTKNLPLTPEHVSAGSGKKIWWQGECGHEWEAVVGNMVKKTSNYCPVCNGQQVLKGFNDLATTNPTLVNQWHPTLNKKTPEQVSAGSSYKVTWVCESGHVWVTPVYHRTKTPSPGCPYCSGRLAITGVNDLKTTHPEIAAQWHPTKNGNQTPYGVKAQSNFNAWWLGECGHEWKTAVSNRNAGKGCPYCSGNKTEQNKSVAAHPELSTWWSPENIVSPETVNVNSKKEYLWLCEQNHSFVRSVISQKENPTCLVCEGKILLSGFNDLATKFPSLVPQWSKNNIMTPETVLSGNNGTFLWVCPENHEELTTIKQRMKYGCGFCANRKILKNYNDLQTLYPEIAAQWHPTKNNSLTPHLIGGGSGKKVWWQCEKGHEWETTIVSRTAYNLKCPTCSGRKLLTGFNDLETLYPELMVHWSDKNTIPPNQILPGSETLTWWVCERGHESFVQTRSRTNNPESCRQCWAEALNSKAETDIIEYLQSLGETIIGNDRTILEGKELDIYIPSKKFAVEFNGVYWHSEAAGKNKNYHYDKWRACKDKGVQLIQVWEDDWNRNPELVKRMLAHKLGVHRENRVYARETTLKPITKGNAHIFLSNTHLQGSVDGSIRLGLYDKKGAGELVAVMVLKTEPGTNGKTLNLLRYATSQPVPGGFTKLLTQVEKTYTPESIVTFSDNTVSDGGLYKNNGFIPVKELKPDYMYVVNGQRKHKFGYRLKRFRNDPTLQYVEGLTEKELAQLNNFLRIWDAGKTKWMKTLKQP